MTTTRLVHCHTPGTTDVRLWLDVEFPEGDVEVEHTAECDRVSYGDECVGGCPVVNV